MSCSAAKIKGTWEIALDILQMLLHHSNDGIYRSQQPADDQRGDRQFHRGDTRNLVYFLHEPMRSAGRTWSLYSS